MAKFKPPRPKREAPPVKAGLPCVVLVLLGLLLVSMLILAMLKGI